MTKKRYTLMLDEESVELVKAWLRPKGVSFSGYINSLLNENIEAIKVLDGVENLKDLSLGQLTELYANMSKELSKEKEKKEQKKK